METKQIKDPAGGTQGQLKLEVAPIEGITFRFHYLTVSFRTGNQNLLALLRDLLGPCEDRKRGGYGYTHSVGFLNGAVYYSSVDVAHSTMVCDGKTCEVLDPVMLFELIKIGYASGGRVTRIDLAFDNVAFTPGEVWARRDSIVTKANRSSWRYTESCEHDADTMAIGSRSSERYLRIYNRRGYTRVELELKGAQSSAFAKRLTEGTPEDASLLARRCIRAFCKLDDGIWDFFSSVEPLSITVRGLAEVSIENLVTWMLQQVAGPLAALNQYDHDLLVSVLDAGRGRRSFVRYLSKFAEPEPEPETWMSYMRSQIAPK